MDLSRIYVCFLIVFLGVFVLGKVLPCELPSGRRLECGTQVSSQNECPKTCCFNTTSHPNCYFDENDYGPIRHSNGLCINVEHGSGALIWSRDCVSRNAFFLVSYDYPPYHVATGKCVLPRNGTPLSNPGNADLFLRTGHECTGVHGRYQPTTNGNLKYYYGINEYHICIGSKSAAARGMEPIENERVSIQESVCEKDNSCKLSYVYERKIDEGDNADLQCKSCPTNTIKIIWANYSAQNQSRYPECATTESEATSVVQEKCSGKTSCSFEVRKSDFLTSSNCWRIHTILFIRYTCDDQIPAPDKPTNLAVTNIKSRSAEISWKDPDNTGNGSLTKVWIKLKKENSLILSITISKVNTYKLDPLTPVTTYEISVAAGNKHGFSEEIITSFTTLEDAPEGPPLNVTVTAKSSSSLSVTWEPPEKDKRNGMIVSYTVCVSHEENKPCFREYTTNEKKIVVDNLINSTKYYVRVLASTKIGRGPYSESRGKFTNEKDDEKCTKRSIEDKNNEKYLVGIIVVVVLLVISLAVIAYLTYQNRQLKLSKENRENKNKDRCSSKDIRQNPDKIQDDANYEQVGNEQSTYTALKKTGKDENDDHLYAHLNDVHNNYENQKETGI